MAKKCLKRGFIKSPNSRMRLPTPAVQDSRIPLLGTPNLEGFHILPNLKMASSNELSEFDFRTFCLSEFANISVIFG
jgi:hypothetical protein